MVIAYCIMPSSNHSMNSRQVSDDEEEEGRFNRFANERDREKEKLYRQRQSEANRLRTTAWVVEEGSAANPEEEEEEVELDPVVRPKNPALFKGPEFDSFKAPRLPRHRILPGRKSPSRPPPQVPTFHQPGEELTAIKPERRCLIGKKVMQEFVFPRL